MRSDSPNSRSTRSVPLHAGATALMTLVAIAATASAAPAPTAAQVNCTAALMEHSGVRAVAAVVAAAARDFFGGEQHASAPAPAVVEPAAPDQPQVIAPRVVELPRIVPLGDHLLNLPPPAC